MVLVERKSGTLFRRPCRTQRSFVDGRWTYGDRDDRVDCMLNRWKGNTSWTMKIVPWPCPLLSHVNPECLPVPGQRPFPPKGRPVWGWPDWGVFPFSTRFQYSVVLCVGRTESLSGTEFLDTGGTHPSWSFSGGWFGLLGTSRLVSTRLGSTLSWHLPVGDTTERGNLPW